MTTTSATSLPLLISEAGPAPTPVATINAVLIAKVSATNVDYSANLPGSLVDDVGGTMTAGLALMDQMRVDNVNAIAPRTASPFIVNQQGQIYGVEQGQGSNASVQVIFTGSQPGYVIEPGFTVGDGTFEYVIPNGGVIGSNNQSASLYALCSTAGTFAIPANSVTELVTSVPAGITLTVTNPTPGTPSTGAQSNEDYLAQVLQAGQAVAQGLPTSVRTALQNVDGVQARLVRVIPAAGNWEIICGGGDPYQVAYAISRAVFNVGNLVGSTLNVVNISQANPGVVTTAQPHGLGSGLVIKINGIVGMTELNGVSLPVAVIDAYNFSILTNTTSYNAYVSGGVITPNPRNQTVSLNYYPDTYPVTYVQPLQQAVTMSVVWNTISQNFVNPVAISQLAAAALVAYVNLIAAGLPMNLFVLQSTFQTAVADVLPPGQLTKMVFSVFIDGIAVAPETSTGIIQGDPEGYLLTSTSQITITQG